MHTPPALHALTMANVLLILAAILILTSSNQRLCVFDVKTLYLEALKMISLADFQPLSMAKINIFHQQQGFYTHTYRCQKPVKRPLYKLHYWYMKAPVSRDPQVYQD